MNAQWQKMKSARVADLLASERLGEAARVYFVPDMRPDELMVNLCEAGHWQDAVMVASCTLPPREAVWWACVCARKMESIASDEDEMAALKAAELWVYKPNEKNQLHAFECFQRGKNRSAGSLTAGAATFNASKLPLADGNEAEMDESVFTNLVAGAVITAAGDAPTDRIYRQFERFMESATDIANGGDGRIPDEVMTS